MILLQEKLFTIKDSRYGRSSNWFQRVTPTPCTNPKYYTSRHKWWIIKWCCGGTGTGSWGDGSGETTSSWDCQLQWEKEDAKYQLWVSVIEESPTTSWRRKAEQGKEKCFFSSSKSSFYKNHPIGWVSLLSFHHPQILHHTKSWRTQEHVCPVTSHAIHFDAFSSFPMKWVTSAVKKGSLQKTTWAVCRMHIFS